MKRIMVSFLSLVIAFSFSTVVLASSHAPYPTKISKQLVLSEDDPAPAPTPPAEPTPEPTPSPEPEPK
jgi:hypothetical protein